MELNTVLHGFRVTEIHEIKEVAATLIRMTYEKNGADLIWLKRNDDNKTFAIGFKTIPEDDTGVFHILEHSVLNGSEKFPVKEPFVNLLKSSLKTFLNAFTGPDFTMYPVSSRNAKDFMNLMDVYLDAVMHPLSMTDPHAFLQEGWHYEPDGDKLKYNGVVYSEMKGAFSDTDRIGDLELNRMVYPDNCYSCCSGGLPEAIPTLTYEMYKAAHDKYYHPGNSVILVDGDMDIDAVLGKIDEYLCAYGRADIKAVIPDQKPVSAGSRTVSYPVSSEEELHGKNILGRRWVVCRYDEREKIAGLGVLTKYLCGSNEAPLTKALLKTGWCEDVALYTDSKQQTDVTLMMYGVKEGHEEELWALAEKTLKEVAIDEKRLTGILSKTEFVDREKDFGATPKGLVYAMSMFPNVLYGGKPEEVFDADVVYPFLRSKLGTSWYRDLICECLIDNPHVGTLTMVPSLTLEKENAEKLEKRLSSERAAMSDADFENVCKTFEKLRLRQNTPDTPEQTATLPTLSPSDVPETCAELAAEDRTVDGVRVLTSKLDTNKIIHLNLYFTSDGFSADELSAISLLTALPGSMPTEQYSVQELENEIDTYLGHFGVESLVIGPDDDKENAKCGASVKVSFIENNTDKALALLGEILNKTDYSDGERVINILKQQRFAYEQEIKSAGNTYASRVASASFSVRDTASELMDGVSMFRWLKEAENGFEKQENDLLDKLAACAKALFTRENLTIGITGNVDDGFASRVLELISEGGRREKSGLKRADKQNIAIVIPSGVGYAACILGADDAYNRYSGAYQVASTMLRFEYLWNEIRVKGGAYGAGIRCSADGLVAMSTYRDPKPDNSFTVFEGSADVIRAFCKSGESIDNYIISTMSSLDPLMSERLKGDAAQRLLLNGKDNARRVKVYREALHTTKEDLLAFADYLDSLKDGAVLCVIAGKELADQCAQRMDKVENL